MSDSRGGCQLAAVPWSTPGSDQMCSSPALRAGLSSAATPRAAKAGVGEYTADTGPPGDRPCPAGPRDGAPPGAMSREQPGGFYCPGIPPAPIHQAPDSAGTTPQRQTPQAPDSPGTEIRRGGLC